METSFRNEGFRQYIVFEQVPLILECYEVQMLLQYKGETLLPVKLLGQNGDFQVQYDISGCIAFAKMSEEQELSNTFLQKLFETLWMCFRELEEYFLHPEGIILDPQMIFYHPGKRQLYMCYMPQMNQSLRIQLVELIEFCMKHTNHNDSDGVMFIYGLYRYVQDGIVSWEEIRDYIHETGQSRADAKQQKLTTEHNEKCGRPDVSDMSGVPDMAGASGMVGAHDMVEVSGMVGVLGMSEVSGISSMSGMAGASVMSEKKRNAPIKEACRDDISDSHRNCKKAKTDILFYVYMAGAIICTGLVLFLGLRFLLVTGQPKELKGVIVSVIAGGIFIYNMLHMKKAVKNTPYTNGRCKRMQGSEENALQKEEPMRTLVKECEEPVMHRENNEGGTTLLKSEVISKSLNNQHEPCWILRSLMSGYDNILLTMLPGVIGRKTSEVDYVIAGEGISRRHAMVYLSGDNLCIEDLNSTNGTYVDEERLTPGIPVVIKQESVIRIGPNRYCMDKE